MKDTTLDRKDGHGQFQATAQMSRAGNIHLAGSLDRKNDSQRSQQAPSIGGYVSMPEESTWSQNIDSAASMFPQTPRWEEEFQDLSSYCQTQEQNMSCGKDIDTKNSSCIVPDDELNTPEICIPEFDFTRRNVLSRAETSPVSLFGGETWDLPIINEKIGDGATPDVKHIQSSEIVSDQMSIPSVVREEEIDTSHETVIMLEDTVNQEMDINVMSQDNVIVFVDQTNSESATELIGDTSNEQNVEATLRYLESLITQVPSQNTLPAVDSFNDSVTNQIKIEADNYMETESDPNSEELVQENMVDMMDTVVGTVPTAARKSLKQKSNLSLNLAGLFTAEDLSTPVILESLIQGEEEVVSFENLLDFVQADVLEENIAVSPPISSTVDFSAIASSSSQKLFPKAIKTEPDLDMKTEPVLDIPTTKKTLNVQIVKPVTIKKTSNGKFCVADKLKTQTDDDRRFGKKIIMNRTTRKISHKTVDTGSVLTNNPTNTQISKRKISEKATPRPRGRPPREPTPSTSRGVISRPKRQRKVIEVSDYEDDEDEVLSQHSSKRSRLSSIESDGDKYREHRDRNNEASRKSRFNRKVREQEMKESMGRLEKENQSLRIKAEEMEKLVKRLREELLEVVTKGKK